MTDMLDRCVYSTSMEKRVQGYLAKYRKVSNIRRTKSHNLNDSHLVLKSSLPNPLKPGVKSRMKM